MPYLYVENFEAGLDTRKSRYTAPPGSLRVLKNAHITRGKEIERRKAFAVHATLPGGTFGLHSAGGFLYTFGSGPEPGGMPPEVVYQQLATVAGDMVRLWDVENFKGKIYAIAEYDSGVIKHFYDGIPITEWDDLAEDIGSSVTVARALGDRIEQEDGLTVAPLQDRITVTGEPGVPFTWSVVSTTLMTATDVQTAVAAQPETRATASFEITGGSPGQTFNTIESVVLDGVDLIGGPVDFDTDAATTAQAVANRVNAGVTAYDASAAGAVVTITAPAGLGASANGRVLEVATAGDVTVGSVTNMAGGADPTDAVPQITYFYVSVYESDGDYHIQVNGTDYRIEGASSAKPTTIRAVKEKMYAVTESLLYFSGFAGDPPQPDPTKWVNYDGGNVQATGGFTITGGSENTGVNQITSVTVDDVTTSGPQELLSSPVDFLVDAATTAGQVASAITQGGTIYTATADGARVTITVPEGGGQPWMDGDGMNGAAVAVTPAGDVTVANVDDFSGGRDEDLSASVIGAGFIDMSTQDSGSEDLVGIGLYQSRVAAFSRQSVQIWSVDPDPAQNVLYQVLLNVGAVAPGSIVEYGDLDLFFLSESGVRSLRARDSSNLAAANDVGVAIDKELTDYMATLTRRQIRAARATVEPAESRYLLALGERVYVFSNFPGSKVSAWSTYELGGQVTDWAAVRNRLYARVGDTVRLYGGVTGDEYDDAETSVVLPFLDASNPAGMKRLTGIDAGLDGTWKVDMASDPNDPDIFETLAILTESSYGNVQTLASQGRSTHYSLRLTTSDPSPAVLGNVIIHYDDIGAS